MWSQAAVWQVWSGGDQARAGEMRFTTRVGLVFTGTLRRTWIRFLVIFVQLLFLLDVVIHKGDHFFQFIILIEIQQGFLRVRPAKKLFQYLTLIPLKATMLRHSATLQGTLSSPPWTFLGFPGSSLPASLVSDSLPPCELDCWSWRSHYYFLHLSILIVLLTL